MTALSYDVSNYVVVFASYVDAAARIVQGVSSYIVVVTLQIYAGANVRWYAVFGNRVERATYVNAHRIVSINAYVFDSYSISFYTYPMILRNLFCLECVACAVDRDVVALHV